MSTAVQTADEPQAALIGPRPDKNFSRHRRGLTHLLDAEDVIHQRLTECACTHSEAAELARALVQIRQQVRREQMKPDAKPIDVSVMEANRKRLVVQDVEFSETPAPAEASS